MTCLRVAGEGWSSSTSWARILNVMYLRVAVRREHATPHGCRRHIDYYVLEIRSKKVLGEKKAAAVHVRAR